MKKGDILYCKKYTSRTLPSLKNNGRVMEFNIGDKCEIVEYYGKGTMTLKKVGVEDYIGVLPDVFSEHFETVSEHRNRLIEDLL